MGTKNLATPELIRAGGMREMLRSAGPCVTILLPPYRLGEQAGSQAALLRSMIPEASKHLIDRGYAKSSAAALLAPLDHLCDDPALLSGSRWSRAVFCSPTVYELVQLTQPFEASLTVSGSFSIRKMAAEMARPPAFYILALSRNKVVLLRCAGLHAEPAKLPAGVPTSLAEAMDLDAPDHDLENRSAAGSSVGDMRGVRFGTGSGREQETTHLGDFYRLVDRGVQDLLHEPEIPLVLAGVEEEMAAYRLVSTCRNLLMQGITGSPALDRELDEILRRACDVLRDEEIERQASALIEARERTAPSRFSTELAPVLRAAFEGRVHQLYVNAEVSRQEVYERGTYLSWGPEDLLNLAAVQTIVNHGKVCELPGRMMPEGAEAAALMRF
jgi:hypothetical protein